jgi:hypothetical protein
MPNCPLLPSSLSCLCSKLPKPSRRGCHWRCPSTHRINQLRTKRILLQAPRGRILRPKIIPRKRPRIHLRCPQETHDIKSHPHRFISTRRIRVRKDILVASGDREVTRLSEENLDVAVGWTGWGPGTEVGCLAVWSVGGEVLAGYAVFF